MLPRAISKAIADAVADPVKDDECITRLEEALAALPGVERISDSLYRHHGYQVSTGVLAYLEADKLALERAGKLTAAPAIVQLTEIAPLEGVLVVHYEACTTGSLQPAKPPFSAAARAAFERDMQALADRGLMHVYAARGLRAWLVCSDTGNIVLDDWGEALRSVTAQEAAEALARIRSLLAGDA